MLAKNSLYLLSFYDAHENLSININRDITMMKHAQQLSLMNRSDSHRHTSSLARRALLLVSFLLLSLGSVWGQEYYRYELTDIGYAGGSNEHRTISQNEYSKYVIEGKECYIEVTFIAHNNIGSTVGAFATTSWSNIENITIPSNVTTGSSFSVRCLTSKLDDALKNLSDKRIVFNIWTTQNNQRAATFSKAEVLVPKPDDPFLNTASANSSKVGYSDNSKDINIDSYGSFTLSKIKDQIPNLPGIKYARIYVVKDNKNVEYNTEINGYQLLEVTDGKKAGKYEENGLYVYNGGNNLDLNAINVTLNAGAGNLDKYKVVVLLSTGTITNDNGTQKEPQWNYEYTYSFAYPINYKVRYKTLVIDNNNSPQVSPILLSNWFELAGDCGADKSHLASDLCVRWYLEDANGNEITTTSNFTADNSFYTGVYNGGTYKGAYKKGGFGNGFNERGDNTTNIKRFTIRWNNPDDYKNVRLVCVASTKTTNSLSTTDWQDPDIQVKYVYIFKRSGELKFAHYEGEAYRYMKEIGDDATDYDYLTSEKDNNIGGDAVPTWNSETNAYDNSRIVRQNVHTVEYTYYVKAGQTNVDLTLPLQEYNDNGSSTEPRAYFRWYDYKTDKKSDHLTAVNGSTLNGGNNSDYGLFVLNLPSGAGDPKRSNVGVNFNAPDNFNKEILIACDVSRYMDGMDESFTRLVHEPTLSIRYLFRIKPATEIAAEIAKSGSLAEVEEQIRSSSARPTILEDEGRMVVSTNDGYGEFSLRTKLSSLKNYYIGENNPQPANSLWWYAYYYDENTTTWWRHLIPNKLYRNRDGRGSLDWGYRTQSHQAKYSLKPKQWPDYRWPENKYDYNGSDETQGDFDGNWEKWTDNGGWTLTEEGKPRIDVGNRVQMVACVDVAASAATSTTPSDITDKNKVMPIIWMELEFINAKPVELDGILNAKETDNDKSNWKRTAGYMRKEYDHAETLKFDDFSVVGMRQPKHSAENYNSVPLHYPNAQYGFIYPQLYGYCATMRILTWGGSDGCFGMAPMHGDYTILKSMNMPGISMDKEGLAQDRQSMQVDWVNINRNVPLFDVTYESNHGKNIIDGDNYGGFIYVDAADEARTIASLEFDASLCTNAKIYYTAYVASMTGYTLSKEANNGATDYGKDAESGTPQTAPMLRFRVSTTKSGRADDPERVPVVTFVTGNIRQEVSYVSNRELPHKQSPFSEAQWYQVYGYTTIPSELNKILTDGGLNGKKRHYFVEIDNYCDNTDGADYCVDQISFYTYSAAVKAHVDFDKCEGEHEKTTIRVNADAKSLIGLVDTDESGNGATENKKTLYYRIYERLTGADAKLKEAQAVTGEDGETIYTLSDNTPNKLYGSVTIDIKYYKDHIDDNTQWNNWFGTKDEPLGYVDGKAHSGFYIDKDEEGNDAVFFQIFNANFLLDSEKSYFISFYDPAATPTPTPEDIGNNWGHPYANNDCSMYSNDIRAFKVYIELIDNDGDDSFNGDVQLGCGGIEVEKSYRIRVHYPTNEGEYKVYGNIQFDFFAYSGEENAREKFLDTENIDYNELMQALRKFRDVYQDSYEKPDDLPTDYNGQYTQEVHDLLIKWMNGDAEKEGKLLLSASTTLKHTFTTAGEKHFAAFPVQRYTSPTSEDEEICSPMDIKFNVDGSIGYPQMRLGFDDVVYPETYTKQVVRVGLKQLEMMKASNYKLHIPVQSYSDKVQKRQALYFLTGQTDQTAYLTISAVEETTEEEGTTTDDNTPKKPNTTDPVLLVEGENAIGKKFAKIESLVSGKSPYVDNDHMYLSLDLSECNIDFHEGYEYEVSISFMAEEDLNVEVPCLGDLFLVIKVVPEYVTWDSQLIKLEDDRPNDTYYSANWYDDANWSRSKHNELYKTEDAYKDGQAMNPAPPTYPGYVPMKFTYVTLLTENHAPSLIAEPKVTEDGKSAPNQGGGLIALSSDMKSTSSPFVEGMKSFPTTNIRYDMMVRYSGTDNNGAIISGGCYGHRKITTNGEGGNNDTWADAVAADSEADVFDVEKFYGNWAKEIYFKPEAELINQQFLTYGKAWVEKELVANKWYLMSTPLKATYAGDMYVPAIPIRDYSLTPSTDVTGRQVTEAFKDIEFTDKISDKNIYSRTTYPIYQRSWGTAHDSKVIVSKNDAFRSDYSAALKYTTWMGNIAEWGHTFNDVSVDYTTMTGFSIRAHKKDQKNSDDEDVLALIRLPKEDKSYDYYGYSGDDNAKGHNVSISKTDDNIGQLLTNEKGDKAEITLILSENNPQQMDGYILVGNPYMASLDMKKFFDVNTQLGQAYYTYEKSEAGTYDTYGKIRPLQAFFVKKGEATKIVFNSSMMMDGNHGTPTAPNPAPAMRMTAANDRGQSTATVSVSNEAKTVETLFDSNLNDVPMVYTVANGQAMSINQLTELDKPIAFGVTCAASDEPVAVTFSDIEQLTSGEVYVVDAVTGEQTVVGEGSVLTVQPNDYGRYFLVAGALGIRDQVDVKQGIVVSVRGRVVTVTSGEMLTEVRALSLDGATAQQATAGSTTALLTLATPGVYIIKAENVAGEQLTVKVVVK